MGLFVFLRGTFILLLVLCTVEGQTTNQAVHSKTTSPTDISWEWNKYVLSTVSCLSALGSVAIIVTYFLWTDLQTTSRRILVYISIGDFFTVYPTLVIYLTGQYKNNEHKFSCKFQSFVTTTAVMWSFFWTTSLAIYLYVSLVMKNYEIAEKLVFIFHVVNWSVPVILVGTAWQQGYLGYANDKSTQGWCWIVFKKGNHNDDIMWMFICGKFWEIISYFINGIIYFLITRNIKREVSERFHLMSTQSVQIAEQGGRKLALIPVVFVVLRIWGTIRFFIMIFSHNIHDNLDYVLRTLQIIGDQSQGIANFILFCALTEKFKKNICKIYKCDNQNSLHASLIPKTTPPCRRNGGGTFSDHSPCIY